MKKLIVIILSLFLIFVLVGCKKEPKIIDNVPPITENEDEQEKPPIDEDEEQDEGQEEQLVDEDEEQDEEQPDETTTKIILDQELRQQDIVYEISLDVENYKYFLLELFMGGSYDNPITIRYIRLNGIEIDFSTLKDIATKAGDHSTGQFDVVVGEKTLTLDLHRCTNYSQGFRVKSTSSDTGFIGFSLENVYTVDIGLVFTTSAYRYFNEVVITLFTQEVDVWTLGQ